MINKEDYKKIVAGNQGVIVQDFNALVAFIEDKGSLALTKSESAFCIADLPQINELFVFPQKNGLTRLQQKAFPYINALFLLLRISSLSRIKKNKNKSFLHINSNHLNDWKQLTPVEQYGHLLAFACYPKIDDIIGDRFQDLLENIKNLYRDRHQVLRMLNENRSHYLFPHHHLATLHLFGLLNIHITPPTKGLGWDYEKITITPLGNDIFRLISNLFPKIRDTDSIYHLLAAVKPLFPDWKKSLIQKKKSPELGIHIFKVSLGNAWRQIAIKGDSDLKSLSDVILQAFEFEDDHLHEFSYKNENGLITKIYHYECEEELSTDEIRIGDLNLEVDSELIYLFDFGDNWRFQLVLEDLNPDGVKINGPTMLKKHGEAPIQYPSNDDDFDDDFFEI